MAMECAIANTIDMRGPRNSGFDDNVDRPADHDEMFDIVAPDEKKFASAIQRRPFDEA